MNDAIEYLTDRQAIAEHALARTGRDYPRALSRREADGGAVRSRLRALLTLPEGDARRDREWMDLVGLLMDPKGLDRRLVDTCGGREHSRKAGAKRADWILTVARAAALNVEEGNRYR